MHIYNNALGCRFLNWVYSVDQISKEITMIRQIAKCFLSKFPNLL